MNKDYIKWKDIVNYSTQIADLCRNDDFDIIYAIGSGGLIPGTIIAKQLEIPIVNFGVKSYNDQQRENIEVYQYPPHSDTKTKVLVVDDIYDSGKTIEYVEKFTAVTVPPLDITYCTLFKKVGSVVPPGMTLHYIKDVPVGTWIVMCWEENTDQQFS